MIPQVTAEFYVPKKFLISTKFFLKICMVKSDVHSRRVFNKRLEALPAVVDDHSPKLTIFYVVRSRWDTFRLQFQFDHLGTKFGVQTNIKTFYLGLSENGLNNDFQLFFVDFQVNGLFNVVALFIKKLSLSNQQLTELTTLFYEVSWSDLIQPKSDPLFFSLFFPEILHVLLGLVKKLLDHFIYL